MAEQVTTTVQFDKNIDEALEDIKKTQGIPKAAYIRIAVVERMQRVDPETFEKFKTIPE